METETPQSFDWPLPEPGSDEEAEFEAEESVMLSAEDIRDALRSVPATTAEKFIDLIVRTFDDSPAPDESVRAIELILESDAPADFVQTALTAKENFKRLFVLCGHSRWLSQFIVRGGWRQFLRLPPESFSRPLQSRDVRRELERESEQSDVKSAIRRVVHLLMLRVLAREVIQHEPVETVADEISLIADGAIEFALESARQTLAPRFKTADANTRLCVIAVGKLGASELNYCSDVDLIFLHEGDERYAIRLAEAFIPLLDETTEDGFAFRVDTRLRPEGKQGRLSRTAESAIRYFFSFGTTLERQAMIKARPCAGDLSIGQRLVDGIQDWVYQRTLTMDEISKLKSLKRTIEKRTHDRDESFHDIKTGFGGIRDIETVAQFLQLLHAGRDTSLRPRDTLSALRALASGGVVNTVEAADLRDAYRFMRLLEHRVQVWEGRHTHLLPSDPQALAHVGACMGYQATRRIDQARAMVNELTRHTTRTRTLLKRLFSGLFMEGTTSAEAELVLDPDLPITQAALVLARYDFQNPEEAWRRIQALAIESSENALYSPRARTYLASMMPSLLSFCEQSPDPDFTLRNFERMVSQLGARTLFFELVAEDPRALSIFGGIAAHSHGLSEMLARRPGLVDEFIDRLQTFQRLDRGELEKELGIRVSLDESVGGALQWQYSLELLRIGLFDVTSRTPLFETLRELATLAEVILIEATRAAIRLESSRDRPCENPDDALTIIAMGKLGSNALNYASDLDLVFVWDDESTDRAIAQSFFTRVARRVQKTLALPGLSSRMYEVDFRLRPRGRSGNLASSVSGILKYFDSDASFWERIAGCRARVLPLGSKSLQQRVREAIHDFVFRDQPEASKVREIRHRVESDARSGDLKRSFGGTIDVEFLVSFLQMKHYASEPRLNQPDLLEAIEVLRESHRIDPDDHAMLTECYAWLRQTINRNQLVDGDPTSSLPDTDMDLFARRMGYSSTGDTTSGDYFEEELAWRRQQVRALFNRYVS